MSKSVRHAFMAMSKSVRHAFSAHAKEQETDRLEVVAFGCIKHFTKPNASNEVKRIARADG